MKKRKKNCEILGKKNKSLFWIVQMHQKARKKNIILYWILIVPVICQKKTL